MAPRLAAAFGTSAEFWMNLQKSYELDVATEQIGAEIKRTITRRPLGDLVAAAQH